MVGLELTRWPRLALYPQRYACFSLLNAGSVMPSAMMEYGVLYLLRSLFFGQMTKVEGKWGLGSREENASLSRGCAIFPTSQPQNHELDKQFFTN